MGIRKINESTLTAIANAIRSKTGGSALINPEDMADEIESIQTGGSITNGIVFDTLDSSGKPLTVRYYGDVLNTWQFCGSMYGGMWNNLTAVRFPNGVKTVGIEAMRALTNLSDITGLFQEGLTMLNEGCFRGCTSLPKDITLPSSLQSIQGKLVFDGCTSIENVTDLHGERISGGFFNNCTGLKTYIGKKITTFWGANQFEGCSALERAEFGDVGIPVTLINYNNTFTGCTNSNLVIIFYCRGNYVDTLVSYTRNGATNATIICKASENTTYNGESFSAGDTILTSTP